MMCRNCQRGGFSSLDHCATCQRSLCRECFNRGCCGKSPALSGQHYDRRGFPVPVVMDDDPDDSDSTPLESFDPDCDMGDTGDSFGFDYGGEGGVDGGGE